ncbi:MAG: hypothetical protein GY844_28105 [Bradyrhizobium sp.]|nr:hypothetical protein [Bradyrhizobium sp.]
MQRSEPSQNVYSGTFSLLVGCVAAGLAIFALLTAPAQRAASAQLRTDEIAAEDRDYCRRLRMPEGTADFAACSTLLKELRKREADRSARDAAGIL